MKKTLMMLILSGCAYNSLADVTFDFRGTVAGTLGAALEGKAGPIAYENGGIGATFTAMAGVMNANAVSFGIHSDLSGEDSAGFDPGEGINITFDRAITLNNIYVNSWNSGVDIATIFVDDVSSGIITATGSHDFNITFGKGAVLSIRGAAGVTGNGWSLNTITVIPEPAVASLVGLGGLLALIIRRVSRM